MWLMRVADEGGWVGEVPYDEVVHQGPDGHECEAAHQDVHVGHALQVGKAVVWLALKVLVLGLVAHVPDRLVPELLLMCFRSGSHKEESLTEKSRLSLINLALNSLNSNLGACRTHNSTQIRSET